MIAIPGGDGSHSIAWAQDVYGNVYGLVEHHKDPDGFQCGGWLAWKHSEPRNRNDTIPPAHQLVAGGPEYPLQELTIEPSLQCRRCPSHGYIRSGQWVDA